MVELRSRYDGEPGCSPGNDYLLATRFHSVREFVEGAFAHIGRHIAWRGSGVARRKLGWSHRIGFTHLIGEMMESDLTRMPHARQRYGPE
jgi:GDP-D-mannose dehydratase